MDRTGRNGQRRVPLRLYITFFLAWVLASGLVLHGAAMAGSDARESLPAWFFVAGTGILVLALVDRDLSGRRVTQRLLDEREALIQSMGSVTDPRLSQLPLYQLLDELLDRSRTVLDADTAAVYLLDPDLRRLTLSATSGAQVGEPERVVEMAQGIVGRVAATRRGVATDVQRGNEHVAEGIASILAAPLVAEGVLVGVLKLGSTRSGRFGDEQLRLLQVVADRAAVAIDSARLERQAQRATLAAEGARLRLALLADAGEVLAGSYERVQEMVERVATALVPVYGDWFAFHQVHDTTRPRLIVWEAGPEVAIAPDGGGDWQQLVEEVLAEGQSRLVWGDDLQGELYAAARARQLTSVVIQPILLRGVRLGTVMFGTAGQRRGLRPGDVLTVSDLAARLGVAIERVMLGAETQQAAVRAARHALQLQRLAEAAAAIHAALDTDDVALVLAQQARLVFDAGAARVNLRTEGRRTRRAASVGRAPKSSLQIESPMTQPSGGVVGSVEVLREGAAFSPDEEAVLASLAQIASVALANARLYADVHDREARLRAMYDTAPIGIVELDAEGRGLRWNHAAEALFGWPPCDDDAAGNVRLPDAAMPIVAQVLAEDGPVTSVDVALPNADAELVAVPLSGAGGRTEVMLAGLDLTERNQVAEQLQLAQRMEAMASVSGGIAHDFNNVLMVITGYTDLILRRELDDDMRADVEAMRAAAKRAADFTRKLLTISRRQLVQPQQVDVTEAVEALRDVLGVMLGSGIDLEVSLGDVPPVWIDPAQFEQVVINLAMNARDAMPEGGRLTVAADPSARGVVLTVADTGQGMDAAAVEHCFEPFFTTKDRTKGTGLGLSTVYGIVTQAGGEVAVESKPGVGTTFCVELPAAEGVKPMRSDRPLRVLVVDDEPDVRAVVTDMLEFAGHEVLAVADGPTALKQLKRFRPEVLLTDVVMPDMRGPELAQRAVELRKRLRVVLMSSHVDDEEALRGLPERTTFLAKPFSPETLADALAGATEGQGSKR